MEQHQRQQRGSRHRTHHNILQAIARLERQQQQLGRQRRALIVHGGPDVPRVDRHSLEHLVTFLDNLNRNNTPHEVVITELELAGIRLSEPPDGGLNVLRGLFARSDTTLTKVALPCCDFGRHEDASQLLAAFEQNRTVSDLTIQEIRNLEGAALGNSLSSLLQNMPQLRRLNCTYSYLRVEGVRAFQPGLRNNQTLKKLDISFCEIGDEGIHLVADALVGNTTIEILDISWNGITSVGLADITRLLESTQLKTINFSQGGGVFNDEDTTQHFVSTLQHKKSSVQELPAIEFFFPVNVRAAATYANVSNSLTRNRQLNHVGLLLTPPPRQQQSQPAGSTTMMLKISHRAITKFAMAPSKAGASAIFKLFQARPALLEKRIKRRLLLLLPSLLFHRIVAPTTQFKHRLPPFANQISVSACSVIKNI